MPDKEERNVSRGFQFHLRMGITGENEFEYFAAATGRMSCDWSRWWFAKGLANPIKRGKKEKKRDQSEEDGAVRQCLYWVAERPKPVKNKTLQKTKTSSFIFI